ncbi:KN motif and ankyrin repeat domain-containing protein 4-like [Pholidichthys leucotaenia]
MMERLNGNMPTHKTVQNGFKGKPPYSVETPYGFRLDLDFLKYVDDIEKGNTIKRIPIQRRSKGSRASTLLRHLNPSGCGYRPSPWGSTGALGPRSQQSEGPHHGYNSWVCDHRLGLKSLAEMEARIKEFDEQPLGEHIRPHLLRASSLPLTVLLRQGSESTDDPSTVWGSRDNLRGRNTSCEDIFLSPDSPHPQDCLGLLRRLTEALERVGELEMEVRVIPELRAQISILQEERTRLRLCHPSSVNGTTHPRSSSHYSKEEIKRPRHETHNMFPKNGHEEDSNPTHEWRASTDLDELLTVTSLQAKVAALEQKLHETGLELKRVSGLLKEQQEESRRKDEKMEHLQTKPGVWVRAERVVVEQDGDETVVRSIQPEYNKDLGSLSTRTVTTEVQMCQQEDPVVSSNGRSPQVSEGSDTAVVVHHVKKIKTLLDQQWKCLCTESRSGEEGHPDPKVNSLQREMMGLVNILVTHYTADGHGDERIHLEASESIQRTDGHDRTSDGLHSGGADEGLKMTTEENLAGGDVVNRRVHGEPEQRESHRGPRAVTVVQVEANPERKLIEDERRTAPDSQMVAEGAGSGGTDGGGTSVEAEASKSEGQMEENSGSETNTRSRDTVSADFISACYFLKDHMDNMENPNNDMRNALVIFFQHWFSVAAEENSETTSVSMYLKAVKKETPSLLAFLVNLADDNGNTVLHYSVSHCNYDTVNLLLETGVTDVNFQNNAGYTAVMLASLTAPDGPSGMEGVRKLMELSNVNVRSRKTGQTALHLAVRHGRVVMVRLLLSCGADGNIQDLQGTTALMFASERGHTHIARLLLERSQCDLTLTDKRGQTALSIALQGSHADTAALLQAHAKARAV